MQRPVFEWRSTAQQAMHTTPAAPRRSSESRRRWPWIVAALAVLGAAIAAALVALGDPLDVPPAVGVAEVVLRDDAFGPAVIQVAPGTEVTWTWADGAEEHNLVGRGWGDGTPRTTGAHRRTFDQPGSYQYACTLHFRMSGRVDVVEPAATN